MVKKILVTVSAMILLSAGMSAFADNSAAQLETNPPVADGMLTADQTPPVMMPQADEDQTATKK